MNGPSLTEPSVAGRGPEDPCRIYLGGGENKEKE